jgi:galactose-1-phosphate uridylyltransferase
MLPEALPPTSYLIRMADGTVKQLNPFTGTEVWTVPGRGNRPLGLSLRLAQPLDPSEAEAACAFCWRRMLETPPEKARLVPDGDGWMTLRHVAAENLYTTEPEFRCVPNLFEIISYDYWARNYGFTMPDDMAGRMETYVAGAAGRRHVLDLIDVRLRCSGLDEHALAQVSEAEKIELARAFFAGGHELILARRHYTEGATHDDALASSGTMAVDEHARYIRFTSDAARDIYRANRYVRYVAVFQNWLQPAGASFDHLHKQLVAIDGRGVYNEMELRLARANPNLYNEAAANFAAQHNLVFAENDHAIAFAGFGHRFPTLEIYSKSDACEPWNHTPAAIRGVSDLLHACHAAMGPTIPCNEEWHYRPPDADVPMPWRVLLKWRITTPAGFEGGTRIYVNTIDPHGLCKRMIPALTRLRATGAIAPIHIGTECPCRPNSLRYNPAVRAGGGV